MISKLNQWYKRKADSIKMRLVKRWTEEKGLTCVCIVKRAGTDYIVAQGGHFHRIGKPTKAVS